jgi:hypothetical protein
MDPDLQARDALQGAFLASFVLSIVVVIRHDGVAHGRVWLYFISLNLSS